MTHDIELGPGSEFDLIRKLRHHWGPLAVSIGDDASILNVPRGERLVVSTDSALEDVHFRREWLTLREIGYRAVTAAISDIAAMAASPAGVLVALQLPGDLTDIEGTLLELADGIADAVRAAGTVVVGGNLARGGSAPLGITTTAVGSVFNPLTRAGARPGDLLYVTGALGGPAAALKSLTAGLQPNAKLRERFSRPAARVAEARWLAAHGAVAGIDLSDGMASDAGHLAAAGGVGLEIAIERLPVFAGATPDDAVSGGEEYELLVASRTALDEGEFKARFGIELTAIGRAVEGSSGATFTRAGKRVAAPPGYDHFSR
ncbi:MAG TPA: thiamine-phosphate kinase [Gemmatimonadaceae bacterium]|nr:thiamine-phosphate kinase [Gemmatimonadaceae bacterium]